MLKAVPRTVICLVAFVAFLRLYGTARASTSSWQYMEAARQTSKWIQSTGVRTHEGIVWPVNPADVKTVEGSLYSGTPGPILFLLEEYRYTRNQRYLHLARLGADSLLASMKEGDSTGLYTGLAGSGFTLGEVYLVTHDEKYREGALQCVTWLQKRAKRVGNGVEWSEGNDIISGGAGTGLFLLWADRELKARGALELAIEDGEHLVELGQPQGKSQMKWAMGDAFPKEMPNFSHGTAGVAYFLATLYQHTRRNEFLESALAGASYLLSIAYTRGDMCMIFHDSQNKTLFYLSWCHGPAGTARLFYRLYQITNDPQWLEWVKRSAKAMILNDAPSSVVTPGQWHNVGACCGVTAQSEFFLNMFILTRDSQYLDLARKGTDWLLSVATHDESGTRWLQAETRVKPDIVIAQTGFMQGASGVGMWLLHMGFFAEGRKQTPIVFPDNPFSY